MFFVQLGFSSIGNLCYFWRTVLRQSSAQSFRADCAMTEAQTFNRVKSSSLLIYLDQMHSYLYRKVDVD